MLKGFEAAFLVKEKEHTGKLTPYKTDLEYLADAVELVSRKGRLYQAFEHWIPRSFSVTLWPCSVFGSVNQSDFRGWRFSRIRTLFGPPLPCRLVTVAVAVRAPAPLLL